jgi:hypothetical protein
MKAQTFILKRKKTFRRGVRVYVKDIHGKMTDRVLPFTTEHLIHVKQRKTRARTIPAEYTTSNQAEIEALFADSGYGKDFFLKGDPEGKLKTATRVVTAIDAGKIALRGLFKNINLQFDESKPIEVLKEEYKIHASAMAGIKLEKSTASQIPLEKVDVAQEIADTKETAREMYKEKYGEEVPEEVYDDVAFLSAMSDPNFNAKEYIDNLGNDDGDGKANDKVEDTRSLEELQKAYTEEYGTNPPNPKKNDAGWIKKKLADAK